MSLACFLVATKSIFLPEAASFFKANFASSIFAISKNVKDAEKVLIAMEKEAGNFSYLFHSYISPINHSGVTTF